MGGGLGVIESGIGDGKIGTFLSLLEIVLLLKGECFVFMLCFLL